jgi:hypothetical protein
MKFVKSHFIYSGVGTVNPNSFFGQYILILLSSLRSYAPPDYRTEGTLDMISDSESDEAAVLPAVLAEPHQQWQAQVAVAAGPDTIKHGEYTVVVGGPNGEKIYLLIPRVSHTTSKKKEQHNMVAVYTSSEK